MQLNPCPITANGFEFWRLLYRELAPDNHSKSLIWRRSLLSPKFPSKETEFSAALQEWEADVDRYEAEYGAQKAISDEDKRAVVLTEAPNALKQHLSMHIATLSTYQAVREVVVSYLQAKQVWKPSAAYAGSTARSDPMEIGLVQQKGKGKDKGGKGKDGKKGKGKDQKGKGKDNHWKDKGGKGQDSKDRCAICWKAGHTTEKCWFNTKGQEKGKGKKAVAAVNEGDNASIVLAGPSASQVGGNNSVITLPSSSSTSYRKDKNVSKIGEHRQRAAPRGISFTSSHFGNSNGWQHSSQPTPAKCHFGRTGHFGQVAGHYGLQRMDHASVDFQRQAF